METLLRKFQLEKARAYAAAKLPGFSEVKYRALLSCLSDCKLKDMAKMLGISYGVLRKWRSEREFKLLLKKHCEEFAQDFIKEFRKVHGEDFRKFIKNPKSSQPLSLYPQFKDCHFYGKELRVTLHAALFDLTKKGSMPPEEAVVAFTLLKPSKAFLILAERVLARNALEKIISELKKGGIKADEVKAAVNSLELLKTMFF